MSGRPTLKFQIVPRNSQSAYIDVAQNFSNDQTPLVIANTSYGLTVKSAKDKLITEGALFQITAKGWSIASLTGSPYLVINYIEIKDKYTIAKVPSPADTLNCFGLVFDDKPVETTLITDPNLTIPILKIKNIPHDISDILNFIYFNKLNQFLSATAQQFGAGTIGTDTLVITPTPTNAVNLPVTTSGQPDASNSIQVVLPSASNADTTTKVPIVKVNNITQDEIDEWDLFAASSVQKPVSVGPITGTTTAFVNSNSSSQSTTPPRQDDSIMFINNTLRSLKDLFAMVQVAPYIPTNTGSALKKYTIDYDDYIPQIVGIKEYVFLTGRLLDTTKPKKYKAVTVPVSMETNPTFSVLEYGQYIGKILGLNMHSFIMEREIYALNEMITGRKGFWAGSRNAVPNKIIEGISYYFSADASTIFEAIMDSLGYSFKFAVGIEIDKFPTYTPINIDTLCCYMDTKTDNTTPNLRALKNAYLCNHLIQLANVSFYSTLSKRYVTHIHKPDAKWKFVAALLLSTQ